MLSNTNANATLPDATKTAKSLSALRALRLGQTPPASSALRRAGSWRVVDKMIH
jgi:hypothetical protein